MESIEIEGSEDVNSGRKSKNWTILLVVIGVLVFIWIIVRPGVFTIQPIGMLPEGVTFIYSQRNAEMSFFASPDGICLKQMGGVSLLCRGIALGAAGDLTDRIILKLPYSHWAYLQSTGGTDFEK